MIKFKSESPLSRNYYVRVHTLRKYDRDKVWGVALKREIDLSCNASFLKNANSKRQFYARTHESRNFNVRTQHQMTASNDPLEDKKCTFLFTRDAWNIFWVDMYDFIFL